MSMKTVKVLEVKEKAGQEVQNARNEIFNLRQYICGLQTKHSKDLFCTLVLMFGVGFMAGSFIFSGGGL